MALVDELWSGVAVSGAPSVEGELGLSHRGYVLFAFSLPLVAAALLEAGLALVSDLWDRRRLVVLGQVTLAGALGFTAWTASPWGLTLGLGFAGAASGVACGAAQALLWVETPEEAEVGLARWSLYSAVGDVLTPLLTALAVATGHSYRAALTAIAVVVMAQGAASAALLGAAATSRPGDGVREPLRETLRATLCRAGRMPRLWAWLLAAASCTLLDELVIALAALRLERFGSAALATAAAVAFSCGSIAGAALTERAVSRVRPRAVLMTSAALCAVGLAAFLGAGGLATACVCLFLIGLTSAPHHPLAMARAYRELPDRPGTVQAIGQAFVAVEVAAPLALGVVAERFGLGVAIGCLLVQPVVVLVAAAFMPEVRTAARSNMAPERR